MLDFFIGEGQYGLRFLFAFIVVLGLIGLTAWLVRRFGATNLGGATARGRQPRLAVIDAAAVDGRRRLVLIRRDNVEHLLMIGGPTDVVIEPNIVRAGGARDLAPPRQPAAADTLPRPVPLGEATWPLQPEPAPAPHAASRRVSVPPQPIEEPQMPWPEEPEPLQAPRPSRALDPLAGLAAELSRNPPDPAPATALPRVVRPREGREPAREPSREVPREAREMREPAREPREPREIREPMREAVREQMREVAREPARAQQQPAEAPFASSADQNLAEMAQRLEAALRRPGAKAEARPEPKPRPLPEPPPIVEQAVPEPTQVEARRDAKPAPQRSPYDSLEQEMASLLGRPNSKA
jgi:flagellar protein FliO/FliZ